MKIIVSRLPGDRQGPDIVDPLLTSDQAGVARGTMEIDASASKIVERGNCPLLPYMATGALVNVTNASGSYRGKLKSYALTIDISEDGREFTASSSISIERVMA